MRFDGASLIVGTGMTIDGAYEVATRVDDDNYTIVHSVTASGNGTGGGSVDTHNGGGGITTAGGGGQIDTTGTGLIELGEAGTRTSVTGTAPDQAQQAQPNVVAAVAIQVGTPCQVCGNGIDDVDLAELGLKRFGKVLCVSDYLAQSKK